jgi:hypothetical protein
MKESFFYFLANYLSLYAIKMEQSHQGILIFVAGTAALMLFGVGLIAPLTPSYGVPAARDLMLFLLGPVLILAASIYYARSIPGKIVLGFVLLLILAAAINLIYPMYDHA